MFLVNDATAKAVDTNIPDAEPGPVRDASAA